jgi:hypothetical protein
MRREYYTSTIADFLKISTDEIYRDLLKNSEFSDLSTQKDAWLIEINALKETLLNFEGSLFFEYSIPRMGKRIDVVLIIKSVIFVLYKKCERTSTRLCVRFKILP